LKWRKIIRETNFFRKEVIMKKFLLITISIILASTCSFAADFAPIVMTLTSPAEIEYQFDGNTLSIPFTVTGTPAAVWLVINTKGQAANIVDVRNGYLGWHYVNKIDTTVYISSRYSKEPGETTIVWDGNDQDGNALEGGTYDYYLWAYDDKTPRQFVSDFIQLGWDWESQYTKILEIGEDGLPLANPILDSCQTWWMASRHREEDDPATNPAWKYHGNIHRWVIGSDPLDLSFLQTTYCNIYSSVDRGNDNLISYGGHATDPNDHSIFYQCCVSLEQKNRYYV